MTEAAVLRLVKSEPNAKARYCSLMVSVRSLTGPGKKIKKQNNVPNSYSKSAKAF